MCHYFYLKNKKSYLYMLRAGNTDYYKIGVSININKRIEALQSGNPHKLTIYESVYTRERYLEGIIHRKLKQYRVEGEWFHFDKDVIKTISLKRYRDSFHAQEYYRKRKEEKEKLKREIDRRIRLRKKYKLEQQKKERIKRIKVVF